MKTADFNRNGYFWTENFLPAAECARLLSLIADYRTQHKVPEIFRPAKDRPLHYLVIDGQQIRRHLPDVQRLYEAVNEVVNRLSGQTLVPLADQKVGVNINIMNRGGTYRWHYDRNAVTAILYLNKVAGGATECYPNYRLLLPKARFSRLQEWLDKVLRHRFVRRLRRKLICPPQTGALLVMRGDRCLHSVEPISGEDERINIIMSYDRPGAGFAVAEHLDAYLYSQDAAPSSDPNYL